VNLKIFLFIFLLGTTTVEAQNTLNIGASLGLVLDFGTHERQLGLEINAYAQSYCVQLNTGTQFSFFSKGLGQRKRFIEERTYVSGVLLGGKRNLLPVWEINSLNHNTNFSNSLTYSYLWYHDNAGTSQRSGAFGLQMRYFSLACENDIFAGQGKDRFRTGHLAFGYRYQQQVFQLGVNIWTGETKGSLLKQGDTINYPYGFRDLSLLPYGNTSHGIFYLTYKTSLPFQQQVKASIGIDSEEIRNVLQNKLAHNLPFLPKKMKRNTPNYLRLGSNGFPVFNKSERRKDLLFLQIGTNGDWSQ
jgi:hypothetical protein